MSHRPLVAFAVCWVFGSAAAAAFTGLGAVLAGVALAAVLLALALVRRTTAPLAAACLAAYTIAAGERCWADARNVTALTDLLAAADAAGPSTAASFEAEAEGTIASAVEIDGDRVQFRVASDNVRLSGEQKVRNTGGELLLVQVKLARQEELAAAADWRRGDRIRVSGSIERPTAATNFGGFDYRSYLRGQRIHWLLKAAGAAAAHTSAGPRVSSASLLGLIDDARGALGRRMDAMYPPEQSGYMKGLVLGIREDLDPERFRQFSQLGLTHILAISGLHVAVFLYILGGLLKLLRMTRERMLLVMMAAVPLYVLLAGGSPSVVRSGLMAVLALAAARMNRLKDGLHLLAAAALLMLAWDPYMLQDVAFQLSFIVTAGLILGVPPVRRLLPQGKKLKSFYDLAAVTVVAQAVSFPLTVYYFNQFHLLSLPANFVLVPFISFIVMPLGGASLLLDAIWHPAGQLTAWAAAVGNELTFGFVMKLSAVQPLRTIWASPPVWWVFAIYAAIGFAIGLIARRISRQVPVQPHLPSEGMMDTVPLMNRPLQSASVERPFGLAMATEHESGSRLDKSAAFLAALILAVLLLWAYMPDWNDRQATVSFIDVGQGDSILIRTGAGKHILIDGGGSVVFRRPGEQWRDRRDPFEVGRKVVVPLLQKRGVQAIDLLVLSHLDSDHIKGLQAVLETIPVRRILWNGTVKSSEDALTLLGTAVKKGIPLYRAAGGQIWQMDRSARIIVLGGADGDADAVSADNGTRTEAAAGFGNKTERAAPLSASKHIPVIPEQNGRSVAILLELYGRTFLMSGDADAAEERSILGSMPGEAGSFGSDSSDGGGGSRKPLDVMKVSHHGSKTSTTPEWVAYWQARTAVISVGRNNIYGHPRREVVARLQQAGAQVSRTDRDGEVQFMVTPQGKLFQKVKLSSDG